MVHEDDPETTRLSGSGARREIKSFSLRVVEGPARGAEISFRGQPVRIGKGKGCDLVLDDPSVSRVHALVGPSPDGFLLEDQQSTNGTQVDGVAVKSSLLHDRCRIKLGESVLVFQAGTWSLPDAP